MLPIISLAHALKRIVVAEGVKTPEQAKVLRQPGCDQCQGYLFSKPMPADKVERMALASVPASQS